jgi:integrase
VAYIRKLPSGKWQATIYLPDGKRRTYTSTLKGEAREWGAIHEARVRRGEWVEPRSTRVFYEDWRNRWWDSRVIEEETRRTDAGTMAKWVDPVWSGRLLPSISRMEVQSWVRQMTRDGAGPHAVRRAYNLLSTMMGAAALEGIVAQSPCRRIDLPAAPPKAPEWFTPEQVRRILVELPEHHALAAALMCWTGLRWGEMAGLRCRDVDFDRGRVLVVGVRTQLGRWKEYPKSSRSRREVPCPAPILAALRELVGERAGDVPVFTTNRQARPLSAANWRVVWAAALERAGVPYRGPHTCRHTAASWLVQAGVPLYDVQRLLGHESYATTARYAHLALDAHRPVEDAWVRIGGPLALSHRVS